MFRIPVVSLSRSWICTVAILFVAGCSTANAQRTQSDRIVQYEMVVDVARPEKVIPPGAVGWGAMWKRSTLWPTPPQILTDRSHGAYIRSLAAMHKRLIKEADVRHISWPWGVGFSTFGVNWENSAVLWSRRKVDCVRGSGWCEKSIVGVGDLLTLADAWDLEAVTVAVPLAVFDGNTKRWGPRLFHDDFTDDTIEKIADHADRMIDFMKKQRGWRSLDRIYLAAGCEWRRYSLRNPSSAVLTYAKLVRRLRETIDDEKVWIVASASDNADIPGEATKAASWNRYLYERLHDTKGIVLDLHRYRGMIGTAAQDGKTPLTEMNIDALLRVGVSQRGFLTVDPAHWGGRGKPMPSVLLENAIHGHHADHTKKSNQPLPWPVVMAHADLVREALASPAQSFLGWTWFPESIPPEWPHGAIRNGKLSAQAAAQGFLTTYHRGRRLPVKVPAASPVRGNATLQKDGTVRVYGGNFSRNSVKLRLRMKGAAANGGRVEVLTKNGTDTAAWNGDESIDLKPMTLFRIRTVGD